MEEGRHASKAENKAELTQGASTPRLMGELLLGGMNSSPFFEKGV